MGLDEALPKHKIDDEALAEYRGVYTELIGFVPPRIRARTDLLARLDPELLKMQENLREHCMYPEAFDTKTAQLMLFGMLVMSLRDAAKLHGIAARRAGATWEEMQAVVNLAFLFGGLSVANRGAEMLQEIAQMEAEQQGSGPKENGKK